MKFRSQIDIAKECQCRVLLDNVDNDGERPTLLIQRAEQISVSARRVTLLDLSQHHRPHIDWPR